MVASKHFQNRKCFQNGGKKLGGKKLGGKSLGGKKLGGKNVWWEKFIYTAYTEYNQRYPNRNKYNDENDKARKNSTFHNFRLMKSLELHIPHTTKDL